MSSPLKTFGECVRAFRERRHWSQEELADRCELHRTYIGGIERGERNVGLLNILKIAQALEVEPAQLLAGFSSIQKTTQELTKEIPVL